MTSRASLSLPALSALTLALSLALPACGSSEGELTNGAFAYVCLSPSDAACSSGDSVQELQKALPQSLAVGARFRVDFKPQSPTAVDGGEVVEAASETFLQRESSSPTVFKALRPGYVGLLARRGSTVVEFLHLHIEALDHLAVAAGSDAASSKPTGAAPVAMRPGDTIQLLAAAASKAGSALAGSLSYTWTTGDSRVAAIASSPTEGAITLRAGEVGTTTVHVATDGAKADVPIVVEAAPGPSGAGGAGGSGMSGAGGAGGAG